MLGKVQDSSKVVMAVLLGGWATSLGASAVMGMWSAFSVGLALGLQVIVVVVIRLLILSVRQDAEARAKTVSEVLANPEKFSRVWLQTGYEHGEYAYIWAQPVGSTQRVRLAYTSEHKDVMRRLTDKGIAIHNGPPGTVN